MADRTERIPSTFRLNLEQQKKRAKDLLREATAGDGQALARFAAVRRAPLTDFPPHAPAATLQLADAQFVIARELRFASWAKLKAHIESMERQAVAIENKRLPPPDGDLKTLHIRCGSDIQKTLQEGGFVGEFLEHAIPYCLGPVTTGPDRHELMARFLIEAFPDAHGGLIYERELEGLRVGEERLHRTADDYDRVVLWMEHDSWDQLVLARLLAHYASAKRPRVLELIAVNEFPGGERFRGLGQLPPEALRLLWPTRKPVTPAQLALGNEVWSALASRDPRHLATLARSGTPDLPIMAPALHRHLRELPSITTGLNLTEQLLLEVLAEQPRLQGRLLGIVLIEREPLPWMGDLGLLDVIRRMERASEPVLTRSLQAQPPDDSPRHHWLAITELGRAVLRGEIDWLALRPPERWVGGVRIQPGVPAWRWNEGKRDAVVQEW
jgi:hypothetical protein